MHTLKRLSALAMIGSMLWSSVALAANNVGIDAGAILDNQGGVRGKITHALENKQIVQQLGLRGAAAGATA